MSATDPGLEVMFWAAPLDPATLGNVLGTFEHAPPRTWGGWANHPEIDPAEVALWRKNGLRLVRVPLTQLDAVQSALHPIDPGNVSTISDTRQWLGQPVVWTEAFRGPPHGRSTVALDADRLELNPGAVRLLTRSWLVPEPAGQAEGAAAALRVELLLQNYEPPPAGRLLAAAPIRAQDQGLTFTRLLCRWTAGGNEALLIVPEHPGITWKPQKKRSEAESAKPESKEQAPEQALPPAPEVPALGELMMMQPEARGSNEPESERLRVIIVLLPSVPRSFDITSPLPPVPGASR